MKKLLMIVSATAMAVSMPALAKPGEGGGGNKGGGGGQAAKAHKGGGGGGHAMKAHRGGGGQMKANRGGGQAMKANRGGGGAKADRGGWKQAGKSQAKGVRSAKAQNKAAERQFKGNSDRIQRAERQRFDDDRFDDRRTRAIFAGNQRDCPPGLDKRNNGCTPPGQLKNSFAVGQQYRDYNDNIGLRSLLGYPTYSDNYFPSAYRSLYSDTDDYYYRYDDNGYIYRVNRDNNLVSSLIPLLGGGFGVGQMIPAGYNVYNVPYQYRNTYYDTNDAYYRYGDNAIYQVDPRTNMITNVAALLAPNSFGIGQPLPMGYDMYNVPYQYRDQYYDTNQYNYRYANGNIYQVDPTTQLITAIISALI